MACLAVRPTTILVRSMGLGSRLLLMSIAMLNMSPAAAPTAMPSQKERFFIMLRPSPANSCVS